MPENSTPNRLRPDGGRPARPDRRDPFVVDLHDTLGRTRQPGSMGELRRDVPAPSGLGWDLTGVPAGSPVVLDLRLEAVTEGVLVTGSVTASFAEQCARCLDPVTGDIAVDILELFAYPNSATDETTDEEEVHRVVDDALDLEPVVRDAVVLGLPVTVLCQEDCAGLCAECGQRWDELPADHAHTQLDPRFAALASWAVGSADAADTDPNGPGDQPGHSSQEQ